MVIWSVSNLARCFWEKSFSGCEDEGTVRTAFLLMIIPSAVVILTATSRASENLVGIGTESPQTSAFSTQSAIPPRESKIAFVSNGQLSIMNADGSNAVGLTDSATPIYGGHPAWSPD